MIQKIKYGDIHLVNCESSIGKEYRKVRPALVVQVDSITKDSDLVTVIPLSSKIKEQTKDDIRLKKDKKNCLIKESILKVRQISTFDKVRFIHKIGEANASVLFKLQQYLKKHFGLSDA